MAKRVSLKGKGADLFFGEYAPAAPPDSVGSSDPQTTAPATPEAQTISQDTDGKNPRHQKASNPKSQHASMPENQHTEIPASQESVTPACQHPSTADSEPNGNRTHYSKATYRLSPEAIEAIDEAKRILRRHHQIKASLEEIAEEAILTAYRDLLENQHASFLVNKLSRKPATQNYGETIKD
jgi:hypothetical protein